MNSFTMTARAFLMSLVLGCFALVSGLAQAGTESNSLDSWKAASGIQSTVLEDFLELTPVTQTPPILLDGFTMNLEAGKSLSYYPPLCLDANGANESAVVFSLVANSKGFAVEMTSIYAPLTVYGFGARGQLVDSFDLTKPADEEDTIFYGLTFTGLVDQVMVASSSNGDGICFLSAYTENDADFDGYTVTAGDCNDGDPNISPAAIEPCDGIDNDCDGVVDESMDGDGDGYYICDNVDRDCEDSDASIHPGASEQCDGVDQNCDGIVDEGTECYDDDGDGYTEQDGDCADADPMRYPGKTEVCDGVDNNCDGQIDASAADAQTWCVDADADGYTTSQCVTQCSSPAGYSVSNPMDCNDADVATYPGAAETCDGMDNDCDGLVDGVDPDTRNTVCFDDDGDGYTDTQGDCDDANIALSPADVDSDGYSTCDGDCDDTNASLSLDDSDDDGVTTCGGDCDDVLWYVYPGAPELCNRVDDDCDGTVDDGLPDADQNGTIDCYEVDQDGDGVSIQDGDCNDSEPDIYPGAEEMCNGLDDDCDTKVDGADSDAAGTECFDDDRDGYSEDQNDCEDHNPAVNPGAEDVPDDSVDQDCDGVDATVGGTETPTEPPASPTPGDDVSPTPSPTPELTTTPDVTPTPGDQTSPTPTEPPGTPVPSATPADFAVGGGCACQSGPSTRSGGWGGLAGLLVFAGLIFLVNRRNFK